MNGYLRFICLFLGLSFSHFISAQSDEFYLISTDYMPDKYKSGITRAENLVQKGERFLNKVELAQKRLEHYHASQSTKPLKILELKERVYRLQLKASSYFYDAHRHEFKTLKKFIKAEYPLSYKRIGDEVAEQFYRASVLRKRGKDAVPSASPMAFLHEAVGYEKRALKEMEMIYRFDKVLLTSRPAPVLKSDGESPSIGELKVPSEKSLVLKPETAPVVQEGIKPGGQPRVFFSIQFLATQKPVSEERARSVYNGALPLIKSYSDGWHRYSAGYFSSVDEAVKEMQHEGIYGFVVAFDGQKKISINKAKQLLRP